MGDTHHHHSRPQNLPMTEADWQALTPKGREVILSLWQQNEQFRKSLAEHRLNENLTALFDEAEQLVGGAAPKTGKRVLVADDSALIRKMVRSLAEKSGCQLVEAEDGEAAMRVLQEQQIELLVLDINMPKLNGLQVLHAIRSDDKFKNLPVVMLTTSSDRHDVATAIGAKVQGYLLKDNREDLAAKLLKLMQAS